MDKVHDLRCFIVADDLTGSCDAAVHFAERGMTAEVALAEDGSHSSAAQVVALNTNSRCVPEEAARHRVRTVFQAMDRRARFVFKKVDSSLRGNVFAEVSAAAEVAGCDLILVAPALPALNRPVRNGRVCLPDGGKIAVAAALRPLQVTTVSVGALRSPATLLASLRATEASRAQAFCFDAESNGDLEAIVALGLASGRRVLWVGSAGMARAIAQTLARTAAAGSALERCAAPASSGPILFGIGSDHAASLAQIERLRGSAPLLECAIGTFSSLAVQEAIGGGRNVLLHLPRCGTEARQIEAFAKAAPLPAFGGIVLAGGDTAAAFLQAIGAHTLQVQREAMPGVPVSTVRGGVAHGMTVITKSGAFGNADTLLECIEYLQGAGAMQVESSGER